VATVEQAVGLGADGVGLNLYVGSAHEAEALERLAGVEQACDRFGMPLMLLINPLPELAYDAAALAYVTRVAFELGADLVKTDYSGDPDSFRGVVEAAGGLPVLVEESPLAEDEAGTLATVEGVLAAGGAGVLLGGRFWSAEPVGLGRRVLALVHGGAGR
jgi:DhnA family fructose-bisphosphate aldolase class Ia